MFNKEVYDPSCTFCGAADKKVSSDAFGNIRPVFQEFGAERAIDGVE